MNWHIASIIAILVMASPIAIADPPLVPGHYNRVEPATGMQVMEVTTAASERSNVLMHGTVSKPGCTGTVEVKLEYTLPATYRGETLKYATATCAGVVVCPGFEFKCTGVGPAPAAFAQPRRDAVTAKSTFWGGLATYKAAVAVGADSATTADKPTAIGTYKNKKVHGSEKAGVLTEIR